MSSKAVTPIDTTKISAEFPYESKYIEVMGSKIHYIDEGEGEVFLFIHGNPTSSYLWRNVIPHLMPHGRCIALDLIGMGKSDKPDIKYGFQDSYNYLEAFVEKLDLGKINLVLHDWGSGLGLHWANMHREQVKSIAMMEFMLRGIDFSKMPFSIKMQIGMIRGPLGGFMVKRLNMFIKKMLPDMIDRDLTKEEFEYYAAPYPDAKSRIPLLRWPKDLPMVGGSDPISVSIQNYHEWLVASEIPKLVFYVTPGVGITEKDVQFVKDNFKNTEIINLGKGLHFIQEDYPHEIGSGIANWYASKV